MEKQKVKIRTGDKIWLHPGDYEKASLDGDNWGHTEEIHSLLQAVEGLILFKVWEGAYSWNVLIYEGGQTEAEEGQPLVLIVQKKDLIYIQEEIKDQALPAEDESPLTSCPWCGVAYNVKKDTSAKDYTIIVEAKRPIARHADCGQLVRFVGGNW